MANQGVTNSPPPLNQNILPSWSGDGEELQIEQTYENLNLQNNKPNSVMSPAQNANAALHGSNSIPHSNSKTKLPTRGRITEDAFSSSSDESEDSGQDSEVDDNDDNDDIDDIDDDNESYGENDNDIKDDVNDTENVTSISPSILLPHLSEDDSSNVNATNQIKHPAKSHTEIKDLHKKEQDLTQSNTNYMQQADLHLMDEIMEHTNAALSPSSSSTSSSSSSSIPSSSTSSESESSAHKYKRIDPQNEDGEDNDMMQQNSMPSSQQSPDEPTNDTTGPSLLSSNSIARSQNPKDQDVMSGIFPDVLTSMRQKIESLTLFDSDMMRLADISGKDSSISGVGDTDVGDEEARRSKEILRRSFQQSISASILVSLSHKRYERRRNAAMDIEKVVRSLVQEKELERVRAILILLSDDFVRSTNEDARKGGVVALAACGIGLKKADENDPRFLECKDVILASVVHACQDHNQRVRYYATESLFNVIKVLQSLAIQNFFILFEILRSLYADVDIDVKSGAQLLDKKLKEIIVAAINNGSFSTASCIPIFTRFVHMRNKPTKRLTLTWLQEFSEKLVGSPLVVFLHLFLGGVFEMLADPNATIRQDSLIFLETILPQLLDNNDDFEDSEASLYVDFDKILQSLVTTMEHPDPFVRKVAMYWMSQIIQTHLVGANDKTNGSIRNDKKLSNEHITTASISVRNSLPHVLPGVLLSIGDQYNSRSTNKDIFLPGLTTRSLAEKTNECFQNAVRRDGKSFVSHLDGFIVALREELDSPGGLAARNPPAVERQPYRLDVKSDGSGIESTGWFRSSENAEEPDDALMMSRLCALQWVIVLYEDVVPHTLKAEYAKEFISSIVHQMIENPPQLIVTKSFEALAKITTPFDEGLIGSNESLSNTNIQSLPEWAKDGSSSNHMNTSNSFKNDFMTDQNINFALDVMSPSRKKLKSRDREVFKALIHLYARHHRLLAELAKVIKIMCELQPAEFIFVSFAVELDNFLFYCWKRTMNAAASLDKSAEKLKSNQSDFARDLEFVSCFVQQMNNVLMIAHEASELRSLLLDSIGGKQENDYGKKKAVLFQILLHSFSHNLGATFSLCLWGGAFMTLSCCFPSIDPLDMDLLFFLELDQLIEMIERPIFRHLHLRMLESETDAYREGSGAMLFRALKSILMLLPQSTSYNILKDRLLAVSQFRQSAILDKTNNYNKFGSRNTVFIERIKEVRKSHCDAKWRALRADSLEPVLLEPNSLYMQVDVDEGRRQWLGYANEEDEKKTKEKLNNSKKQKLANTTKGYEEFDNIDTKQDQWRNYWINNVD